MTIKFIQKTGKMFLAACLCLCGAALQAGMSKDLGEAKHALGWDSLNLKAVESDKAGRTTLEKDGNPANRIERKTSYHSNGKKAEQVLSVVAKDSDKTLYVEKKAWSEHGILESEHVEDDAFKGDGKQTDGQIDEKEYKHGRMTAEMKKEYSATTGSWGLSYKQSLDYYANGDLKERITETPPSDEKTREAWGARKLSKDRNKTTQKWDSSKGGWN